MISMARRFQFNLSNLLRSTAWLSLSGGAFACLRTFLHHYPLPPHDWWWQANFIYHSLIFIMFWSPMVALGALFGRTKRAMMIGIFAAPITYMLVVIIAVSFSPNASGRRPARLKRIGAPIIPPNSTEITNVQ
jgi:hypothetical protein